MRYHLSKVLSLLGKCQTQHFWPAWFGASLLLAVLRLYFFSDSVARHTFFVEEAANYWLAAQGGILEALKTPDANYFPLAGRLLAHVIVQGMNQGANFALLFKLGGLRI